MKYLTAFDVENTTEEYHYVNDKGQKKVGRYYGPHSPTNFLVSVGLSQFRDDEWKTEYIILDHKDLEPEEFVKKGAKLMRIQEILNQASLLIGHNIKHDLQWAWAVSLTTPTRIWDTMCAEYIIGRGDPGILYNLGLDATAERHHTEQKKLGNLVEEYLANKTMFDEIPMDIVETYGSADCVSCGQVYQSQVELLKHRENETLQRSVTLINYFTYELARMESVGMTIDLEALDSVRNEYLLEQQALSKRLHEIAEGVLGDRLFSLSSGEDLSVIMFSRKPRDKKAWSTMFVDDGKKVRRRMNKTGFKRVLSDMTEIQYRQDMHVCPTCAGTGKIQLIKKDNTPYKNLNNCKECGATGTLFTDRPQVAGFKFLPKDAWWISSNGFSTDKEVLEFLKEVATAKGMHDAAEFCEKKIRLNQVNIYLQTFCSGIRRGIRGDDLLHANFNQALTVTTRLSSNDPNMQNIPRGTTFPVKRAFVSRWVGGMVLDVDFAQLEFRIAVAMARCEAGLDLILSGDDVHKLTYTTLTEAGQPTNRQAAKPHTFKPLYGGVFGTPPEMAYYKAFLDKYKGIDRWQGELQDEAIRTKKIRTPTGKEYAFPFAKRNHYGGATGSTRIKNYPVQGTATGDIVPWGFIFVSWALRDYKSVVINTVHDSILVDVHPEELDVIPQLCLEMLLLVEQWVHNFYEWDLYGVPIAADAQMGKNWGEVKEMSFEGLNSQKEFLSSMLNEVEEYREVVYCK